MKSSTQVQTPRSARLLSKESAPGADASSRRILLLTTSYPPRTEVGAARWEGFTPFLVGAHWGVDVLVELPPAMARLDWERLWRLPADVRVAAVSPGRAWWHEALMRIRAPFKPVDGRQEDLDSVDHYAASPAPARMDLREVVVEAMRASHARQGVAAFERTANVFADERHTVVVSSGPPHYVHVAASRVAQRLHIPHVVDLRDPWANARNLGRGERFLPDPQLRSHEAETLARASLIITNTAAAERALAERFPALRDRIRCMPNGSDLEPEEASSHSRPPLFQIAHCGSLYLDRDPRPFLRAVGRVREALALGPRELRVVFMGTPARVAGRTLTDLANEAGLDGVFEERPTGTRDEARELLRESSMAVAFQGETRTQVPAKVFEYVAFPVWLLALVGAESATADVLAGSDAIVLDIDDQGAAERAIESCYRRYHAGESARPLGYDGRFSRARQAERLIAELQELESKSMRRAPLG